MKDSLFSFFPMVKVFGMDSWGKKDTNKNQEGK
jgi:hypothetical protein